MIEVWGVLPGEFMGAVFNMLTPVRSMTKYNLDLLDVVDDETKLLNFLRMEKWLADRPTMPVKPPRNGSKTSTRRTNSSTTTGNSAGARSTSPGHDAGAQHLCPRRPHHPAGDLAGLDGKLGTNDYTEMGLPGGHIGMFVSSKSQGIVGKGIVDWLADRDA